MFRNEKFQSLISTLLLSSFTTLAIVPGVAAAQGLPQLPSVGADGAPFAPLQRRQAGPESNRALLPLDKAGLPAAKGMQPEGKGARRANLGSTDAYANALARFDALARRSVPGNAMAQINAMRLQYKGVAAQAASAKAAFAATEAHLVQAGVPAEIIARNRAAQAQFAERDAELKAAMSGLDAAAEGKGGAAAAAARVQQLLERDRGHGAKARGPSKALPWGHGKHKARPVALTERAHESLFPRSVQLASAGSLSGIDLPDAILSPQPGPADLAETDEAQLTPEIRALAAKLSNNPVQIYNWVRNNVRYTPGYGVMQGAAATLQGASGNAYDTASLLVALNRAAGIPARYVYGTVEVPAARMQSWLGVQSPNAVQALMNAAGIPNKATQSGGKIDAIQFEHVWVQAFADFSPSRGAVNKTAGKWVPLDASFKLSQETAPLDLRGAISLNEAALFDAVKSGAACTATQALGLNVTALQDGYAQYRARLDAYLVQQGPELSVGEVLGNRAIGAENFSILLGTLAYKTIATGAVVNVLPEALRWQYRFQLFADAPSQAEGKSTAALTGSFAALGGKRITLSFAPATEADAATLASYLPRAHADSTPVQPGEFPADLPAYLIRLKAELRADGVLVAAGGSFIPGTELAAELGAFEPATGDWRERAVTVRAGDYHAVAIDAQGVSGARLLALKTRLAATAAKLAARQEASLTRDDVSGDVLYQAALAFFATADANAAVFQRAAGVVAQRLPSYGRAVAPVQPHTLFGTIHKISFPGVTLDIDRIDSAVAARSGGLDAAAYQRQSNQRDASYARLVLANLFTNAQQPTKAVSAVSALASAAVAGQAIHAVTAANAAALLPQLGLSADAYAAVENAAGAGQRVLVAQGPIGVGIWSGHALQIEDLATGAGAYELYDELGSATANVFPALGMGWLALAQPFQSGVAVAPALTAGQAADEVLAGMLGFASTRWSYFAGKADVANGLFLARLAAAQGPQACDAVSAIVAANLGTVSGLDGSGGASVAAPVITSAPVSAATAGQAYSYAATASDPQNLALTWRLVDAPAGMSVNGAGLVQWSKPLSGTFAVTLRADNGRAYADQRYMVSVGAEALPLEISLGVAPPIVNLGETVTITVVANGGSGNKTVELSIDGQPVALVGGQAVVTGSVMGAHQIVARVTDGGGTVQKSSFYSVRVDGDASAPLAKITSPVDDAEVTAPVEIRGTAADDNLAYYQLLLRPAGDGVWAEIGRGTSAVTEGVLGKLDPTQLANGIYELALNVVDANGAKTSTLVTLDLYRDLKIGQFAISFEDLNVEAAGIPIRVTRTYDTRRKAEDLDFGYGWSVDYQSVQLRKNMVLGLQWEVQKRQFALCLVPAGQRKINVTLPDGKVERFRAANSTECANFTVPPVDIVLSPLPGTTSQLEIVNVPNVLARGGQLYDMDELEPWNPKQFKLTTEDNYVYYLTDGIGITQIRDPGGNTLTYGQNGIIHSNGQSVAFGRDTSGRITSITDPAGKKIRYAYDTRGDLVSVTDRSEAVSHFKYNRSHGLLDYTDPMGIVAMRYVYDADGRVIAVYDAEGHAVETTHDTVNNREIVKDRRGNETTYVYNSNGDITEVIDALKHKTVYSYDALGNPESTTDANGKTTSRKFDPKSGKQLSEKDPMGHTTSMAYDSGTRTQLESTTDARNNVTSYTYGSSGSQGINEPLGRSTFMAMNRGTISSLKFAGQTTTYTYDAKGNRQTETDAAGNVLTFGYDANGNETSRSWNVIVDGAVKVVSSRRKLDAEGRAVEETDVLGYTSKTTYNAGGQVTSTTDPQGRKTSYEYNTRGKLAKSIYPDGSSETFAYDAEGNQISATDRQGRTTRIEYDALNRMSKTIYPDGSSNAVEYDPVGRVSVVVDANGKRTVNSYDDAGRLKSVTDPDNQVVSFDYDENGNRTKIIDANQKTTSFKYDALNRLELTTAPDGRTAAVVWNTNGTKKSETDFGGNEIQYGYDALGQLTTITQVDGTTAQNTVYEYNGMGNKVSQTDAEGRVTRWTYDAAGRMTSRTLPGGQVEGIGYDIAGNIISTTDFAGAVTRYGHTNTQRLNVISRPDGTNVATVYTGSGKVESITVSGGAGVRTGKTSFAYDANDRLTRQTNPDGSFIAYGYDANGNIDSRSTQAGTVRYDYDDNRRLKKVTDVDGKSTGYGYDPAGKPLTIALPNGVTAHYRYDDNGRLAQLLHVRGDASVVTGVRYTLLANGQREKVEEFDSQSSQSNGVAANPARTSDYRYDAVGRLTQEQIVDRGIAHARIIDYVYDKVGNRTSKTEVAEGGTETTVYAYDSNDRLTLETRTPAVGNAVLTRYQWDPKGNLTSKSVGTDSTFYRWSADNRLIEVKQGASEESARVTLKYAYDHNGIRIAKTALNQDGSVASTTNYLTDMSFKHAQTVQETTTHAGTTTIVRYVWGNGLIARNEAGSQRYYHADGQGSVTALTDGASAATDGYAYDAFGVVAAKTGTSANAHRYTGEYFDDALGFQFNRARWYDAQVGRFVSQDLFPGVSNRPVTLHKYVYAANDPVAAIDPSGYMTMASTGVAGNISSSLMSISMRVGGLLNAYDRVQAVVGFIELINSVRQVFGDASSFGAGDAARSVGLNINFAEAAESAAYNLPRAIGTGVGDWARGYVTAKQKGSKLTGFLIYMPLASTGTAGGKAIRTPAKVKFGQEKIPVKLVFGGPAKAFGQLTGIGMEMGSLRQLIRMDYHPFNSGHGGASGVKANEIAVWQDGDFHYHVRTWQQ